MNNEPLRLSSENSTRIITAISQPKIQPQKIVKFPFYAVFGDSSYKWEVDILRGRGKVENVYTLTVDQMINANNKLRKKQGKSPKELSRKAAYVMAKDRAIAYKEKLEKTDPLR